MDFNSLTTIIVAVVSASSSLAAIIRFISNTSKKTEEDLNKKATKLATTEAVEENKESTLPTKKDVIHIIQTQLDQLNDYYNLNKNQAKYSFNASISAIILGFITVTSGIWLFYLQHTLDQAGGLALPVTAISVVSGVLAQFVGVSYFFMYRTSIQQVNYFFNQLVVMQDTMLTIELVRDLPNDGKANEEKQIAMTEQIVRSLLERSSRLKRTPILELAPISYTSEENKQRPNIGQRGKSNGKSPNHLQNTRNLETTREFEMNSGNRHKRNKTP